ncbi:MAG: hypothetical protein MZV64_50350 [Ignavibacteriales bacterium]|nr:hypothetical protein [Ignavibacteriales bacterium]
MSQVTSIKPPLPFAEPGSEVSYYLHAVDISGRRKNHPYIGAPDPHVFTVGYAETTLVEPGFTGLPDRG